jgi:hypothetical protein
MELLKNASAAEAAGQAAFRAFAALLIEVVAT